MTTQQEEIENTEESPCCSAGIVDGRCGDCKELVD